MNTATADITPYLGILSKYKTSDRFQVIYQIYTSDYKEALERAKSIAIEQTIECPYSLVENTFIAETIVGKIETVTKMDPTHYVVCISYDTQAIGNEFTAFVNTLFGNSSLSYGIRLLAFSIPKRMSNQFKGPRLGINKLRNLVQVNKEPILMSAIKPLGTSVEKLASMVYELASGGCSIIKDDHNLMNQSYAPFTSRVQACVNAIQAAYEETGYKALYIANCNGDGTEVYNRAYEAKKLGADGIMISPGLVGFGAIHQLSQDPNFNLPIFAHPSFAGPLTTTEQSGISPYCYFGQLTRLAGCDASIFTSFNGRFSYTKETCLSISKAATEPLHNISPMFPVPAGGIKSELFSSMYQVYGADVIFLVGGALLTHSNNLTQSTKFFRKQIKNLMNN